MTVKNVRIRKKTNNKRLELLGIAIISVLFSLIIFSVGIYLGISTAVGSSLVPANTYVDNIDVGGMSVQEATALVQQNIQEQLSSFSVTLKGFDVDEKWTAEQVGVTTNAAELIAGTAYQKYDDDVVSSLTAYSRLESGNRFSSAITLDEEKVASLVSDVADRIYKDAVDAKAVFDKDEQEFSYINAENGRMLDSTSLENEILAKFEAAPLEPIEIDVSEYISTISPDMTVAELKENTVLVGECVTETTNDEDRNTNIRLMCEAADGLCLEPGEQLSLNTLVGQRTEEKGFKYAGAIIDGKMVDDVGGGICQMAGTLYNAALLADIEIVERVKHTYVSNYLSVGLDATLNWDDKDLVIANNTEYPIYLSTRFEDNKVTARIYGRPLEEGMTILLRSDILEEKESGNAQIVMTDALSAGERETKQTAMNGYEVAVYKEYWKDGVLLYETMVSHDIYQPRNAIILVGSGSNK